MDTCDIELLLGVVNTTKKEAETQHLETKWLSEISIANPHNAFDLTSRMFESMDPRTEARKRDFN
jgi:hypothetical protein